MPYIKCEDLELGWDGRTVTKGINFEVNKGDYLCIVGENGAGKSTLMKTLVKLRNPIMSGKVIYDDELKSSEMGYLPQHTEVQNDFPATVYEIVMSGNLSHIGLSPFYSKADKERTKKNMERMDIMKLQNKSYRNLSGGQKQRVLLARALSATSKILLLDEPVSGLDPKVTMELYELIQKLNKEGLTIVMISHDVEMATKYASHILHIGRKKMLFYGTVEQYKESELWEAYERIGESDE